MKALATLLLIAAALETVNALLLITKVGKTRDAYTSPVVSLAVALTAGIVVVMVLAAIKLGSI